MSRVSINQILENMQESMSAELVGAGNPLVELVKYTKTDFDGKSPVGQLVRGKTRIRRLTAKANRVVYVIHLHIAVAKVDPSNPSYTEEMAEYALNATAEGFIQWLENNRSRRTLGWQNITTNQDSFIRQVVDDGGKSYWMETHMMEVESW